MSILDNYITEAPFPSRGASKALRDRLILSLMRHRPVVGDPFPSDAELARHSGLSRMTVRKALDGLHREGWIDRRTGLGTFIGPRINVPLMARTSSAAGHSGTKVRMAIIIYNLGDLQHDWYTPQVLAGLDEVADATGVIVELVGDRDRDISTIAKRLASTRPDVLCMIAPPVWNLPMVGLGQSQRIPVLGTGTRLMPMGVPTVSEDGAQGAAEAVRYLASRGHKKIGFIAKADPAPWVFLRREGYIRAMAQVGLEQSEDLVFWPSYDDLDLFGRKKHEQFDAYLQKNQPTAVIVSSSGESDMFLPLIQSGRLSIPKDLSLVGFDQDHPRWTLNLNGVRATTMSLPIREMGRRLATMARAAADGQPIVSTTVPCELVEGDSVRNAD